MSEESFIVIGNIPECKVVKAYSYQKGALDLAIKNNGYINFKSNGYRFIIKPFNQRLLNDDYSEFYTFIRENNEETIISKNKEKLSEFCDIRNRIMLLDNFT
jgi:hypothetical protein